MKADSFFDTVGKMALGSRLRRLTDTVTTDAAAIYKLYDIDLQPKWFPVFYILSNGKEKMVTTIAREIGHSHPSVSKIVSEMVHAGYVLEKGDATDGRKNLVKLSAKGKAVESDIRYQYKDVKAAMDQLSAEASHDLWQAIHEWEFLLTGNSLLDRVRQQKKMREAEAVRVVDFAPKFAKAFRELNEEWITKYFELEKPDIQTLGHPRQYILNKGGHILIALIDREPVGTCALIPCHNPQFDFELVKMAVSPDVRGRGVGYKLGLAAIEKARSAGAKTIYLESNTILEPAIALYHKIGFRKVKTHGSPYQRCNIQMALHIK